jgi:hypothetical protein
LPNAPAIFAALGRSLSIVDRLAERGQKIGIDQALQSLKEILFLPSATRLTIELISKGQNVDVEAAKSLGEYFSQIDDAMADTLRYIDPHRLRANGKLRTDELMLLDEVRYRKISVRLSVSNMLSHYVDCTVRGASTAAVKREAATLLRAVDGLNKQIKKAEVQLARAKRGK